MDTGKINTHHLDRFIPGAICAYWCLLSYGVYQTIPLAISPRQELVLKLGWVAGLLVLLPVFILSLFQKSLLSRLIQVALTFMLSLNIWIKALSFLTVILLPSLLVYTRLDRGMLTNDWLMWSLILPLLLFGALVSPFKQLQGTGSKVAFSLLNMAFVMLVAGQFSTVNSYPFSIGWSEGNRFYDYSLVFGKRLYQSATPIEFPYGAPGRYGLWGIWFLFGDFPIEFHRAWNAFLWFAPSLLFGWFTTQQIGSWLMRMAISFWVVLFLDQGPIYAPLLIAAILVVLPMHQRSFWIRASFLALAGWYVGLSRWTWAIVPGAWGVLVDLYLHYPDRQGNPFRRLLPTALLGLAGIAPGILVNLHRILAPQATTLSLSQPLLWERLLPNATYPPGILLGLATAVGPLTLILAWWVGSKRIRLDPFQWLATIGSLLAFLAAGLVASIKIGGGSNLHNLDMFLVTLLLIFLIWLAKEAAFKPEQWPFSVRLLLCLVIMMPANWVFVSSVAPKILPDKATIEDALEKIQAQVAAAKISGDVLFMDQRQLLTFGRIQNVELVADYEKKYIMDQAMAGNSAYFEIFYNDLKNQRFSLIVSEPLFTNLQDESDNFGKENNAWVTWVSKPILCFYTPKTTLKQVGVQLLVPRENPENCQLP